MFKDIFKLEEFKKEVKRLGKKYRTLEDDLKVFIRYQLFPYLKLEQDNKRIVRISGLKIEYPEIFKAKKFACKAMKGKGSKTGFGIVFAYYKDKDKIEMVEMYLKSEKDVENKERIKKYYLKKQENKKIKK